MDDYPKRLGCKQSAPTCTCRSIRFKRFMETRDAMPRATLHKCLQMGDKQAAKVTHFQHMCERFYRHWNKVKVKTCQPGISTETLLYNVLLTSLYTWDILCICTVCSAQSTDYQVAAARQTTASDVCQKADIAHSRETTTPHTDSRMS